MDPNLMSPSGMKHHLEQTVFSRPRQAGEIGMSRLAVEPDAAGNDAVGTSSDGGVYSCDPRRVSSLTNGQIQPFIAEIFLSKAYWICGSLATMHRPDVFLSRRCMG